MDHPSVGELQTQRDSISEQIGRFGDFRLSNLAQRHRKFSKPSCHSARPDSMGHGPTWTLTIKIRIQKCVYHAVPEEALEVTREHIEQNQRFNELIHQLVEVSDTLCEARIRLQRDKTSRSTPKQSSVNGSGIQFGGDTADLFATS